jgi:transcriptional regulator with XRE-family HTH domain
MHASTRHAPLSQADTCVMEDRGVPSASKDLGDFLRTRRAALDPRRAGLPEDGRPRRVPGLRREELSHLANVSVDYIVRLEQGRTRRVSRPVLNALADALQLTAEERAYLGTLAELAPGTRTRAPAKPEVTPQLRQLLEDMHDIPAMVVHRRMDVLAWNRGAAALLTDFGELPRGERNWIRLMFLDDAFRSLYADWPRAARDSVAVLRMEAGRHPDDPDLIALVGELSIRDADFRTWWTSHPVHGLGPVTRTFHHPVIGTLTLNVHQLSVGTPPDLLVVAYTPPADSPSREALRVLLHSSGAPTYPEDHDPTNRTGHQ